MPYDSIGDFVSERYIKILMFVLITSGTVSSLCK